MTPDGSARRWLRRMPPPAIMSLSRGRSTASRFPRKRNLSCWKAISRPRLPRKRRWSCHRHRTRLGRLMRHHRPILHGRPIRPHQPKRHGSRVLRDRGRPQPRPARRPRRRLERLSLALTRIRACRKRRPIRTTASRLGFAPTAILGIAPSHFCGLRSRASVRSSTLSCVFTFLATVRPAVRMFLELL
jgi:hypothetical protein